MSRFSMSGLSTKSINKNISLQSKFYFLNTSDLIFIYLIYIMMTLHDHVGISPLYPNIFPKVSKAFIVFQIMVFW